MKKSITCICLLSFIFLSACSNKGANQITVAQAGYTCDAVVEYGENFSSNVTVNAAGGGMFSLTINSPQNIAGLTFSFNNSEMTVSYKGVEGKNTLPLGVGGFPEILNEVFLKFTTSTLVVSGSDGEYVYEGKSFNYPFKVIFNEQGFPVMLTVDKENLKATFSNWKY